MTDLDLDRRLERWLAAEAPLHAPERVVHASRRQVTMTAQRRAWTLWQPSRRRWFVPLAAATAVVILFATTWTSSWNQNGVGGRPSPSPSISPSPSPSPYVCARGAVCLGPLSSGIHRSSEFAPALTVTVPGGWTNTLDVRGEYDLSYDAGGTFRYPDGISFHDGISIFRLPVAAASATSQPEPNVGQTARALADWLAKHADIVASQPAAVIVNGVPGFRVAIGPRTGPRVIPDHCTADHGLDQCESLFIGGDSTSGYGFGIVGPESAVIYFLDLPSAVTVMVVIDDVDGADPNGLIGAATPVVESLVFGQ